MNEHQAAIKITELSQLIRHHNHLYYAENTSEITDYEYDLLFRELKALEATYPQLKPSDSPTSEVEADKNIGRKKHFGTFKHPYAMYSLENAMNEEEINTFITRREKDLGRKIDYYAVAPKYDGVAIELIYKNKKLIVGASRGNGDVGEDITSNIKTISNLPQSLVIDYRDVLVVRGEVIMLKSTFKKLNHQRKKTGENLIANARNAAAGSLLQIDPEATAKRELIFFAYQLVASKEILMRYPNLTTQSAQIKMLDELGFEVNKHHCDRCGDIKALKKFYRVRLNRRDALPYEVDGIVIKIDDESLQQKLGVSGRRPRFAIAWKFPPVILETKLIDIQFQVGRTGVLTPVGVLKPVNIGGAWIRRVTLHNKNEIDSKDIMVGDTIKIIRSGDVIPKILSVVTHKRTGLEKKINFPTECPMCHQPVQKNIDVSEVLIFCTNLSCPGKINNAFIHFVSKEAINIEGLGKEFVLELIKKKIIARFEDIYAIQGKDLDQFERMGNKLKENLLIAIENSKKTTLSRFIYALGILGVGQTLANTLAKKFKSIDHLLAMEKESLMDIDKIGETLANNIVNFFRSKENIKIINHLLAAGVEPVYEQNKVSSILNGKRFLFTGTLGLPRHIAKEKAERLGAEISSSLSNKVDYLVVGENPGSKLKKAQDLKIKIISEKEYLDLIELSS